MFEYLWGKKTQTRYLILATVLLLAGMLGAKGLWTMESRWADIVMSFFYRGDFLHPYLNGEPYYDKPLLSYWFMSFFYFFNHSAIALRLPSAIAAGASVWAIFRLGEKLYTRQTGLIAAWMLLTTFYFIFYARVASADMLNLCGVLLAVLWYVNNKNNAHFLRYLVFFLIIALTSLSKGLLGAVLPMLILLPDLVRSKAWKTHLNSAFFMAAALGIALYCFPFWLSAHFNSVQYEQSGLLQVFRENILRFYQPFDHMGSFSTYFKYFPLYLLPWTFFFIPAVLSYVRSWQALAWEVKWMCLATLFVFGFFSLSLSRRSYYILPIIPYAVLLTAYWVQAGGQLKARVRLAGITAAAFLGLFLLYYLIAVPVYYSGGGNRAFAVAVKAQAEVIRPWHDWQIILYGPPNQVSFYLQAAEEPTICPIAKSTAAPKNAEQVRAACPPLDAGSLYSIVVSDARHAAELMAALPAYQRVTVSPGLGDRLFGRENASLVAFIPSKN